MDLYLIRHAQSENNKKYFDLGHSDEGRKVDPGLSDIGAEQATYLAQYIADHRVAPDNAYGLGWYHVVNPTHIFTSLMTRAILTGHKVADALNMPLVGLNFVHECRGFWQQNAETGEKQVQKSITGSQLKEISDRLVLEEEYEAGWLIADEIEVREAWEDRARRFVEMVTSKHRETDSILLISHAKFINVLLLTILELPAESRFGYRVQNTSIIRLQFENARWKMLYHNKLTHLPDRLIT